MSPARLIVWRALQHFRTFIAAHFALRRRDVLALRACSISGQPADFSSAPPWMSISALLSFTMKRLGVHKVGIFGGPCERGEFDLVTADFPGDGSDVGHGRDNVQFRLSAGNHKNCGDQD
jgi:hypothetical protein